MGERRKMEKLYAFLQDKVLRTALITSFAAGCISSGIQFFNTYLMVDGLLYEFKLGAGTISEQRWFLEFFRILDKYLGEGSFGLSLFNGAFSLLFLGLASYFVCRIFGIVRTAGVVLISTFLTVFPTVNFTFMYIYCAAAYMAAITMSAMGAFLLCRHKRGIKTWLLSAIVCICGIAVYQAYIPFFLSLILFYAFFDTAGSEKSVGMIAKECGYYLSWGLGVVAGYFGLSNIILLVTHTPLMKYKGLGEHIPLLSYRFRVRYALMEFFDPGYYKEYSKDYFLLYGGMKPLYMIIVAMMFILMLYIIFRVKRSIMQYIYLLLITAISPVMINLIFVMSNQWYLYPLTQYGGVMPYVILTVLMERLVGAPIDASSDEGDLSLVADTIRRLTEHEKITSLQRSLQVRVRERSASALGKRTRIVYGAGLTALILSAVLFIRFNNVTNLKLELMQSEAKSYYTTLSTRIQMTDGYKDDLPIVYINGSKKDDRNWSKIPQLDWIRNFPANWNDVVNDNSWQLFMNYWCGFDPIVLDDKESASYAQKPEVQSMPCYPDDGSIRVIDGTVVVKFADEK